MECEMLRRHDIHLAMVTAEEEKNRIISKTKISYFLDMLRQQCSCNTLNW